MNRLSLQWRIAFLTAFLIAISCVILNLLVNHSGAYYFDTLGKYVLDYNEENLPIKTGTDEDIVIIDMTLAEFESFYGNFTQELARAESGFWQTSWIITILFSLLSGAIAFFVSGYFLKPLREFSKQVEQIELDNLKEIKLKGERIPEFQVLSRSINGMLLRFERGFNTQKQFIGNAAHELRTPLTLMQARLDLYRDEHRGENSNEMEIVTLLSEQTERLSCLVRTLLDMSELEEIPCDDRIQLAPLIEEVFADLTPLAEKKAIVLKQEDEYQNKNVTVIGSDVLLYRLIFNLVENGIKYNKSHGCVTVRFTVEDKDVAIYVIDTGQGIPKEEIKNIFHSFYRVDKSRSQNKESVGLGLSFAWEVARLHGGHINVEKSDESGTIFVVRLPKADKKR